MMIQQFKTPNGTITEGDVWVDKSTAETVFIVLIAPDGDDGYMLITKVKYPLMRIDLKDINNWFTKHEFLWSREADRAQTETLIELKRTAEYVTAELLACIDEQQELEGWAHDYRPKFRYKPRTHTTLGTQILLLSGQIKSIPSPE